MVEASCQFRRVNGHLHLPALREALEQHADDLASRRPLTLVECVRERIAEQVKADPVGDNTCNACGARAFSVKIAEDLTVDCVVTSDDSPLQGTLYDIELTVLSPQGKVYALDAARYVQDEGETP